MFDRSLVEQQLIHIGVNLGLKALQNLNMHFAHLLFDAKCRTRHNAICIGFGFINNGVELLFIDSFHRPILRLDLIITVRLQKQPPVADLDLILVLFYFCGYFHNANVTVRDDMTLLNPYVLRG